MAMTRLQQMTTCSSKNGRLMGSYSHVCRHSRALPLPAGRGVSQLAGSRDQFCSAALALYKMGEQRRLAGEIGTNPYSHFQPVGEDGSRSTPPATASERVTEFLEISAMIADYGSPEMADQMSGAIYMHASLTEDRCSQCLRLAESSVPGYSLADVTTCLQAMTWWPAEACRSLSVRELVRSLDKVCLELLHHSQHFTTQGQVRVCYLWQSLLCQPPVRFPGAALADIYAYILHRSVPSVVSYLLLLSSLSEVDQMAGTGAELASKIIPHLKELGETELMAAYMGLARLEMNSGREVIRTLLEQRYGYRLA